MCVNQRIIFRGDYSILEVLKEFKNSRRVGQEYLLRKTGLNLYTLRLAVNDINQKVKDALMCREDTDEKCIDSWLPLEEVISIGKIHHDGRRRLAYELADNADVLSLTSEKAILQVTLHD